MIKINKQITIKAPVDDVYRAWMHHDEFPRYMRNVEAVRISRHGRSHWRIKSRLGTPIEFDAETTLEQPNRAIGWRSIQGRSVNLGGRINFTPIAEGTLVEVLIDVKPPLGLIGDTSIRLLIDPERQVEQDLQRFKAIVETASAAQPPQQMAA